MTLFISFNFKQREKDQRQENREPMLGINGKVRNTLGIRPLEQAW
jgi:hypothetical protein